MYSSHGSRSLGCFLLSAALCCGRPATLRAVYWNNDSNFGVASATGLTDRVIWFPNDNVIDNTSNSTRGSSILLNSEWALTVRHVVQNGSDYSTITEPANVYVDVGGVRYYADTIYTPDNSSEMALVHLRGGVVDTLDLTGNINASPNEAGRILEIGGYGYNGIIDTVGFAGSSNVTGTASTAATFHRAYNVGTITGNGQINIGTTNTGNSTLKNNNLLQGSTGPGDSGGPMFAFYGTNFATQQNDRTQWKLVGLTATAAGINSTTNIASWGTNSNYTRLSNYASWITSTLASAPQPPPSTTGPWIRDSGAVPYDTGRAKFSVTGSSAAPVDHAAFGPGGKGFELDHVGDVLSMTATLDTTLAMNNTQFRFGMFDDAGGTHSRQHRRRHAVARIPDRQFDRKWPAGCPRKRPQRRRHRAVVVDCESPNSAVLVNIFRASHRQFHRATAGQDYTPAGSFIAWTLTYTRVASWIENRLVDEPGGRHVAHANRGRLLLQRQHCRRHAGITFVELRSNWTSSSMAARSPAPS